MQPYATVIIPTHDRAATLSSAVASVQRQTVANIEILIVGDGPTPEVVAAAESLANADSRVRFLACAKAPFDAGINVDRGVQEARSERIFYNDDDDVWLPAHVETLGPQLDAFDIVDTLPVSVGRIAGVFSRLHGTLVNSGNERVRYLLADGRLKLTYDTHIAHRKLAYTRLGNPRANTTDLSVNAMFRAFAAGSQIRWKTVPTCTALSLHGAARHGAMALERREEIENLLSESAAWTPEVLLARADFVWHSMRMWIAEAPLSDDTLASYLDRYGIAWEAIGEDDEGSRLTVPLRNEQRNAVARAFGLFQGRVENDPGDPDEIIISALDSVLGGPITVEYATRLLRPYGLTAARQACARLARRDPRSKSLAGLVDAYLSIEGGNLADARVQADRLRRDNTLPAYDRERLLTCCDLGVGNVDAAIDRMWQLWLRRISPVSIGLELAPLLILNARGSEAMAVCDELQARVPGARELRDVKTTVDHMRAGLRQPSLYRLSREGVLLNADGIVIPMSTEILGHVDSLHDEDGLVCLCGWAADREHDGPILRVALFVDGSPASVVPPSICRPDVAAALRLPHAGLSGFLIAGRQPGNATSDTVELRLFAIAADGAANELKIPSDLLLQRRNHA